MDFGNLSCVVLLRPELALNTSSMTDGSRPDLTPSVTASDVATVPIVERNLLARFMVCPAPRGLTDVDKDSVKCSPVLAGDGWTIPSDPISLT